MLIRLYLYALLILCAYLFIIYYIYTKAERYGMNGVLWGIAACLLPIPTLIVFLIITYNLEMMHLQRDHEKTGERILKGNAIRMKPGQMILPYQPPKDDFKDEEMERLIAEGEYDEARKYLLKMLNVAREMGDAQSSNNYLIYEKRIEDAEKGLNGNNAPHKSCW